MENKEENTASELAPRKISTQDSKRIKKDLSSPAKQYIIIGICFALGVLDMIMLRDAISDLMGQGPLQASLVAFSLATVANFTAFMWGRESGKHSQEKSINKFSRTNFLIWVLIGIFYMVLRVTNLVIPITETCKPVPGFPETSEGIYTVELSEVSEDISPEKYSALEIYNDCIIKKDEATSFTRISGEAIQILILAILYISTGLTISAESKQVFDAEANEYRTLKKQFTKEATQLARSVEYIQQQIRILEKYDTNYTSLDKQYCQYHDALLDAEKNSMADIVGKTLAANPALSPAAANKIMENVLSKRKK